MLRTALLVSRRLTPETKMAFNCGNTRLLCGNTRPLTTTPASQIFPRDKQIKGQVIKMPARTEMKPQNFDYFLVLDFEATCDLKDANKDIVPKEVIEFPVLKVNAQTFEIESTFHTYVQPRKHPLLTTFCTELTGIVQEMVDGQPFIEDVLKDFDVWMKDSGLLEQETKSAFVTSGDWDLNTMLPAQCQYFNIKPAQYFKRWINIKRSFADCTNVYVRGLPGMIDNLELPHQGRLHSGIDDCHNILRILKELAERGYVYQINAEKSTVKPR